MIDVTPTTPEPATDSFNTPEGVEGFSRPAGGRSITSGRESSLPVSIPRRVLRGFRAFNALQEAKAKFDGFNTPEGVEGFSSESTLGQNGGGCHPQRYVSIPRRVLRGFRAFPDRVQYIRSIGVSIPRRVLRGFRGGDNHGKEISIRSQRGFNTPEGVEGFSRKCWPSSPPASRRSTPSFNTPEGVEGFSRN